MVISAELVLLTLLLAALALVLNLTVVVACAVLLFRHDRLTALVTQYEIMSRRQFEMIDVVSNSLALLNGTVRDITNLNEVKTSLQDMLREVARTTGVQIDNSTVSVNRDLVGGNTKRRDENSGG